MKNEELLLKTFLIKKTDLSEKYLKNFFKINKENENTSLKNKTLMGGWVSTAAKVFRRDKNILGENFPGQFEDWMYRECGIKK